jgi:phage terminase Nu1 subunit (DNA packaging protein)
MPTQKDIAAHLDLSQPEVSKLLAELAIDARRTTFEEVRVAYIRRLRGAASGHKTSDGDDLIRERVQTERVDRELKQLALAEKRNQLVNVEQLELELSHMVAAFRTEVLALPDRLKSDLDALHGIDVDIQVLTAHAHDALRQLARYDPEQLGIAAPAGGHADSAGADDDDGLGQGASPA